MLNIFGCLVLAAATPVTKAPATQRTTVAVAPWGTSSSIEYQWVGTAMADALALRVFQQPGLNSLTLRQINAAMREDNIQAANLTDDSVAFHLGRQLGADILLVGSYEASWPEIQIGLRVVYPKQKRVKILKPFLAQLDQLVQVEAQVAELLAEAMGAECPKVAPGTFGTENLRAWREATLAMNLLNWQSLGPRAADPLVRPNLPRPALRKIRAQLRRAVEYDLDYGNGWAALGLVQALLNNTKQAWRSLGKATALGAGHQPNAVLGAYFVRMREGRSEEAVTILRNAIERHPGFLHARGYLGELLNHSGRHREAKPVFEAYLKVAPDQPWVMAQLGYTKARLGDDVGAIADTIAAVDLLPDSPSLLLQLASRYVDADKLAGAEDALRHAMELFPNEGRLYIRLGYVYLRQGKLALAIPISEKGLSLMVGRGHQRDLAYAHLNLARAYGQRGELNRAFEHLKLAKKNGQLTFAEIQNDPLLRQLRADPRYGSGGYQ